MIGIGQISVPGHILDFTPFSDVSRSLRSRRKPIILSAVQEVVHKNACTLREAHSLFKPELYWGSTAIKTTR
jgi:hypothetical protein